MLVQTPAMWPFRPAVVQTLIRTTAGKEDIDPMLLARLVQADPDPGNNIIKGQETWKLWTPLQQFMLGHLVVGHQPVAEAEMEAAMLVAMLVAPYPVEVPQGITMPSVTQCPTIRFLQPGLTGQARDNQVKRVHPVLDPARQLLWKAMAASSCGTRPRHPS